ncbi:MAG: quinolinate synthase NadA [bacterium]|nr:quinolinate synthase NadA [bacterium]
MNLRDYTLLSPDELRSRIYKAKTEKNAVLLVHNYQRREVQEIADFLGDSLRLAQEAARTEADLIVFCGVTFMAETAKILNPDKKVLIPDSRADCPMAKMIDAPSLTAAREKYPDAIVVTYINSTADVKALSDICVTSTNAVKIIKSLGNRTILFTPDKNLAEYCRHMTGANIIPWAGHCYVHNEFHVKDVETARIESPDAIFIAHPECNLGVLSLADYVTSTTGMVKYVRDHQDEIRRRGLIIGTEVGLIEQLQSLYPDLNIYPLTSSALCATQKLTNLAKVAWCIENETNEVILDEEIRCRAYTAVKRMLDFS